MPRFWQKKPVDIYPFEKEDDCSLYIKKQKNKRRNKWLPPYSMPAAPKQNALDHSATDPGEKYDHMVATGGPTQWLYLESPGPTPWRVSSPVE